MAAFHTVMMVLLVPMLITAQYNEPGECCYMILVQLLDHINSLIIDPNQLTRCNSQSQILNILIRLIILHLTLLFVQVLTIQILSLVLLELFTNAGSSLTTIGWWLSHLGDHSRSNTVASYTTIRAVVFTFCWTPVSSPAREDLKTIDFALAHLLVDLPGLTIVCAHEAEHLIFAGLPVFINH